MKSSVSLVVVFAYKTSRACDILTVDWHGGAVSGKGVERGGFLLHC